MDGKEIRGWAPGPIHPGPDEEALGWGRLRAQPPPQPHGPGPGPRVGSALGTGGPLASSVGGCCFQPTMMPKVNEVSCVWMHGRCVHACVRGWHGPRMSQKRALQRTQGRVEWGRGLGRGPGWPGWRNRTRTSCLGLRDATGICVLCLFLCERVSRFVSPSVCLHFHVSMCVPGNICMSNVPGPPAAWAAFVHVHVQSPPCLHGPHQILRFIHVFVCYVSEFGCSLTVSRSCLWACQHCCVLLWGVSLCGPVARQPPSPAPCLCPSW